MDGIKENLSESSSHLSPKICSSCGRRESGKREFCIECHGDLVEDETPQLTQTIQHDIIEPWEELRNDQWYTTRPQGEK